MYYDTGMLGDGAAALRIPLNTDVYSARRPYGRKSVFCSCDLDLDWMTSTYERGLDILKMYLHTKNEVSRSRVSKVRARTGQTHRQRERQTD